MIEHAVLITSVIRAKKVQDEKLDRLTFNGPDLPPLPVPPQRRSHLPRFLHRTARDA